MTVRLSVTVDKEYAAERIAQADLCFHKKCIALLLMAPQASCAKPCDFIANGRRERGGHLFFSFSFILQYIPRLTVERGAYRLKG